MDTMKSRRPCPVCGGYEWIPWYAFDEFPIFPIKMYQPTLLVVDDIDGFILGYYDECATCGTMVCG